MTEEQGGKLKLEVSGEGMAFNPEEEVIDSLQDAVEYDAGASTDPMEDLAAEESSDAVPTPTEVGDDDTELIPIEAQDESKPELQPGEAIDPNKVRESPEPTEAEKPPFNPDEIQSPLISEDKEGGVVKAKTTGPTMSRAKQTSERPGQLLKPAPDMDEDSLIGKYEVTGFEVEYELEDANHFVSIRDYFDDLDTAFASVNRDKYLMPMPGGGYKIATIRNGAATISYNERQIYNYKNGDWSRM